MKKYIEVPYWPEDHAKKAYAAGYYIEAIQCIHGFIELQLRELVMLNRHDQGPHEHFDMAVDTMYEISLSAVVKVLFIQKVISKEVRDQLMQFNKVRNCIVHQIFSDKKGARRGIPKKQYDDGYKSGLELMGHLDILMHKIMGDL